MATNLTAGSIAFTGYNGSGNDNLSFVVLTDIAQGTVINFTDNSWNGSSFANSETIFSWTATGNVAAGTVIDINNLKDVSPGPSTNVGSVAWVNTSNPGLKDTDETVYAYVGSASNPTFLAAIANHGFSANGVLTNTGLVAGQTAIDISGVSGGSTAKSGYNGARSGEATFADYLNDINNKANWLTSIAAPFPVDKFTTTASTAQSISFSPATVSVTEGDNGTKTLTFTVTRSGDTTGAITFSGTFDKGTTNAADFGGTLPSSAFNGAIAAGATSATVTIVISGDTTAEASESFTLTLNSASNPNATVTIGTAAATGTIANDDGGGTIISSNTSSISFGNNDHVTIQQGVTVSGSNAATWTGGSAGQSAILDNFGNISGSKRGIATGDSASNGNLTINNEAGAAIQATKDAIKISNLGGTATGTLTIVNDGTIKSTGTGDDGGQALDLDDNSSSNAHTVITNNATGLIQAADADAIRAGINATINNYGQIISKNGSSASDGNDAIDFQSQSGGVINNYEGALIDGARHGITGDAPITVNNNGTITGESGSGINLDSAANTTTIITNSAKGIIVGHAVNGADADGIDVDGLVAIDNFGTIKAVGLSTDGLNEALAVGGGSIHNEAGGQIISDQRAITVDDSNDGNAFGATTIVNQGTIQGGNGEAISITGTFADTVTNKGSIIGSVAMGAGNDTFNAYTGSSASGTIDGGDGNDTVHLAGAGIGTFGETANVETLDVDAGIWMVDGTGDYDAINIAAGATLTSSISVDHSMAITVDGSLAVAGDDRAIDADGLDNGLTLTVEVGTGGLISSSGNDAIGIKDNFDNGQVIIDNAGIITSTVGGQQALDLTDLTSTSTTIHITNQNGGLITAVGGDAIRGGGNTTIDNYGAITSVATTDDLNDAIDFQDDGGGTVHNYAGGSIMGAGHAITGTRGITVINDADASITGQSGSAVNIDNDSSLANTVTVINCGTMLGQANASQDDSDGDAVDVDGLLKLDNYGLISGTGANGTHKGGANVSEGVAAGGGTINNYAGGMIHGYGRAIQIDNSENGGAAASTTIYNEGIIQGDGNGPENFEPGSDVGIVIEGREAIDILGENDDTITNKGMIIGGVFTDGGDDTFNADAGSTVVGNIDLGAGDDTFNVDAGSTLVGKLDLGDGNDTVHLAGGDGAFAKAFNAETLDVDAGKWTVDGTSDYDAINIAAGATLANTISVEHSMTITVGGTLDSGDDRAIEATDGLDNGSALTVNVLKGGVISSSGDDAIAIKDNFENGTVTIDNAGTIRSGQQAIDLTDVTSTSTEIHIINEKDGVITAIDADAIRGGGNTTIDNHGIISSVATTDDLNDAIDFQDEGGGTVHNYAGGSITGAGHAITGARGITVINDADASIVGQSGSAVNIDNDGDEANKVTVTNYGTMLGMGNASQDDSDGDAVDVDGLLQLDNHGEIRGLGANGTHKGGANVSEGVAAGGGTINNYAGATIYGYGRAIQIDDSENGGALAATTIYNEGTIQGDGHGPENFEPGSDAGINLAGREAIDILGAFNDTITNKGTIIGGVFTDGGDDTFNAYVGSTSGKIDLGTGNDTVNLFATDGGSAKGTLGTVVNAENLNVKSGTWKFTDGAANFTNITVDGGATVTTGIILGDGDHLVVKAGGTVTMSDAGSGGASAVQWTGGTTTIDNYGTITATATNGNGIRGAVTGGDLTFVNHEGAEVDALLYLTGPAGSSAHITNAGNMMQISAKAPMDVTIDNSGLITTDKANRDLVKLGGSVHLTNSGQIISIADSGTDTGGEAIEYDKGGTGVFITNKSGGLIEGSHHAITGKSGATIVNEAGATLIGRNGSGINVDNDEMVENTVYVTNKGDILGKSQGYADSDGDAIDVDGLVQIDNWGNIKGLGASGYHDGTAAIDANISEGIAAGGGSITNHEGGMIYGYGRAIQIDDSSNGPAHAATTIMNEGTIQGDGHGPSGTVTPEHAAEMQARINGAEAINIVGDLADTITNTATGKILGGIFTDGGDDTLSNAGSIKASAGSAVNMGVGDDTVTNTGSITGAVLLGAGDDVFNAGVGSTSGPIDGGDDVDTVNLQGTGTGSFGTTTNVENLNVKSGTWAIAGTQNYKAIDVAGGAMIAATVTLGADETLTVEQGGAVQGSKNAIVVKNGTAATTVINDGTINVTGTAAGKADAISIDSGTVTIHNTEHGRIEGARHAITGENGITVINDKGGLIVGHNGSAVNMDNNGDPANAANITNYGTMLGESANISDSDGDAIDVDGLANINNYGEVRGEGHNGYHDGEANVSEAIAIGGGVINNYADGTIYGYGRAIQIDNSGNGPALGAATIYNEGLIQGDGNGPTGVSAGDAAAMQAKIDGREAINILGSFADTITNKGTILGGVFTDGGNDRLTNSGTMTALKDMAIDMGAGDDTVTNNATGVITGSVAMGDGKDSLSNDGTITVTHGNAVSMGDGDDFMVTRNTITGNVDMGAGNDEMISFGRIVGAVSFGDGNDHFNNSNAIEAGAGAVAIDMGAGDDWVNLYAGTSVQGTIQLGTGNDLLNSTADGSYVVDAGDGNDSVAMSGGDDIINGGAGNDSLDGGTGNDQVDGGEGDDTLFGGDGNDTVIGGTGSDLYYYWSGDGNDTIVEGAGNAGDFDTLSLRDFNISEVTLARNGDDLEITMKDGSKIVVSDQFSGGGVENIVLKDGEIDRNDIVDATNHAPTVDPTQDVVVAEDNTVGGKITATDLDGDKLTYTTKPTDGAQHGSVFLSKDGQWTYTPDGDYYGHDSFVVLVSDGHTTVETTINVNITPVNDAPVAVNDVGQVGEHDTKTFDLAGNDTDVEDGHPHLVGFSIDGVDGINLTKEAVANAFQIVDGKLQFVGGDIFGALNDGQHANVHITYTAEDNNGGSTTGEFTLTVDGVTDVHSIDGTNGSDVLFDTGVDDHINGLDGNDVIFSKSGSDIVDAGGGNDTVMATTGNATVNGGDGNDSIIGGSGNTVLNGDNGNDTITGGSGSEVMNGGAGNDTLISNGGNDILAGGQGNDLLIGGTGSDTFVFKPGDGQDTVANFKAAGTVHDVIEVDTHAFADFDALMAAVHDAATGAQLQYTDGSTLTLSGVTKAHLTVDDFKFA